MRGKRRAQALGTAPGGAQVPHMALGSVSTFKSFPLTSGVLHGFTAQELREASASAHLDVARAPAVLYRTTPPSHTA